MTESLHLLDNVGIQGILEPDEIHHMPEARPLPSTSVPQVGREELFSVGTTQRFTEEVLMPGIGDGSIVDPQTFSTTLQEACTVLSMSTDTDVQEFVRQELTPLLENTALLQACSGLLIGG